MNGLDAAGYACLAPAAGLGGLRWLRVAQREHYVAGSVTRFAWRWWGRVPGNAALGVAGVAGAAATGTWRWPALVTAAAVAVGPLGLGLRGRTGRLRWTRRCGVLAVASAVLAATVVVAVALGVGEGAGLVAAATLAAAVPLVVDAGLLALEPVEDRVAGRYVERARARLQRVRPSVVAITGSYGKTTTKGYVAHLLDARFQVLASPRSFNNRGGLSRTVNELLVPGTEVLVAEMGTYGPGEIRALCSWMPPRVAVLTAVGPVHLERFRRIEAILEAKAEITERAEVVVCNVDDERLAGLADRLEADGRAVVRCSAGGPGRAGAEVLVEEGTTAGTVAVTVRSVRSGEVPLAAGVTPGTRSNVACALGAVLALGVDPAAVLDRLADLPGADNRLEAGRSERGVAVLDDTFNSNPAGARVALAALAAAGGGGRRVVVTPGMIELGPLQARENAAFGRAAGEVASDVVVVGRTNRRALLEGLSAAQAAGEGAAQARVVRRREEAVAWVRATLGPGDAVLYENDLPDHFP